MESDKIIVVLTWDQAILASKLLGQCSDMLTSAGVDYTDRILVELLETRFAITDGIERRRQRIESETVSESDLRGMLEYELKLIERENREFDDVSQRM